jgi:arylsulfatase A-like enzyme
VIRKIVRPERFRGSHLGEADFILFMIAGVVTTLLFWHASAYAVGLYPAAGPLSRAMSHAFSQDTNADRVFLWLHLFDPHTPHTPPEPYASGQALAAARGLRPPGGPSGANWKPFRPAGPIAYRNAVLGGASELYAGEVAYTDRQIDRLLDFLRNRGLLASTIVVVIADHGENLEDHGVSYRHSGLWDTTTHVPLMIRWPGEARKGRRLRGLVQNVDVFPTLLAASRLPVPAQDGLDLLGTGNSGRRAVFAEHTGRLGAMVRTERYKYMTSRGNRLVPDGAYLYDLEKDPGELRNLAGQGLAAERDLDALLRRWLAARRAPLPGTGAAPLSPEEEARLRALGYL